MSNIKLDKPMIKYENDTEYELETFLNSIVCPVCGDKLYWDSSVIYDDKVYEDTLILESGCCGKDFKGIFVGNYILTEE